MTTTYKGFAVPDGSDPPDGPGDFRRFADTINADTVLAPTPGEILKASALASATIVSTTTWATIATAGTTVNISNTGLVFVTARIDVQAQEFGQQVTPGGSSFMARIAAVTASQAIAYEREGRTECAPHAMWVLDAGVLTLALEAQVVGRPFQINAVKWSVFSTGGVT